MTEERTAVSYDVTNGPNLRDMMLAFELNHEGRTVEIPVTHQGVTSGIRLEIQRIDMASANGTGWIFRGQVIAHGNPKFVFLYSTRQRQGLLRILEGSHICPKCNAKDQDGNFCDECGTDLR